LTQHSVQPQLTDLVEIDDIPVKNFSSVTKWFYRGGQPDSAAIIALVDKGIRTIISLRWNSSSIKNEKLLVEKYGLNFYSIPLSYWILPSQKVIDQFLAIVDDSDKHPIYLHCLHGRDRTGMLTAIYRIASENWSADGAYAEMKANGFRHIRMHQFKWAVYGFERRLHRGRK
jgi:protein tyrosine/serine phosphatase